MPMPQLTERIKEAPATVLRAIFAGVGQLLLAVDKLRSDVLGREGAAKPGPRPGQPAGAAPSPAQPPPSPAQPPPSPAQPPPSPAQPPPAREETGNVRVLREEPAAAAPAAAPQSAAEPAPAPAPPPESAGVEPAATAQPGAAAKPASTGAGATPGPAAGMAAPPFPNYDELTIASLRARLRGLDAAQVRALLEYERAHAGREAVLAMYERRLAKLAAEAG